MGVLANIGRIFYGVAMAATGLLTIYYHDFPYYFIPPDHVWVNHHIEVIYLSGALLFLAGIWIAWGKRIAPVCFALGAVLLLVFCFYFIPYQFSSAAIYMHFGAWENAAKELALAAGAWVAGGAAFGSGATRADGGLAQRGGLMAGGARTVGRVLFALTIISFGVDHYLYAHEATAYMPLWIGHKLFWLYFTGTCLLGSGIAILLKINVRLFAGLLGLMIFIWVIIVHFPKATAAPIAVNGGEIVSGLIALAYCGIAFIVSTGR